MATSKAYTRMAALTNTLVAEYLRRHGYTDTLQSFESHVGQQQSLKYEPLEKIIKDHSTYLDHQLLLQAQPGSADRSTIPFPRWTPGAPTRATAVSEGLVIHLSHGVINGVDVVFLCRVDKSLTVLNAITAEVIRSYKGLHNSVIKLCVPLRHNLILTCGMDGTVKLVEFHDDVFMVKAQCQIHQKLIIDLQIFATETEILIFSISWDQKLKMHSLKDTTFAFISEIQLLSTPTALKVLSYDDSPVVLVTRMDSSQISYLTATSTLVEISRVALNDSEFSQFGFSPMCITSSSHELRPDTRIVVGTSHSPLMRLIVTSPPSALFATDLAEKMESLSINSVNVEYGKIIKNLSTTSPQDKFSHALISYRADGSGIWIFSDDGNVRGIDLSTGFEIESDGHKGRFKHALTYKVSKGTEMLISCGVDKSVMIWK